MAVLQTPGLVVEVIAVGGTDLGRGPCALLLCCALRVCGVGAAVGRSAVAVAEGRFVASQGRRPASAVSPGALSGHVTIAQNRAQQEGGMERRRRSGLVVLLFTPVHVERRSRKRSSGLRTHQVRVFFRARGQFARCFRQFKLHVLFTYDNRKVIFTLMYADYR